MMFSNTDARAQLSEILSAAPLRAPAGALTFPGAQNLTKTLESGSDNFKVVNKGSHFRIFTWLRNSSSS
jgi:hypothetical protein